MRRLLPLLALIACTPDAARRRDTLVFASGADLQSINPLLTTHPLAKQAQRYLLLTTLIRRDTAFRLAPYLARDWGWNGDRTVTTLRLVDGLRWHDGRPTTARDAAWTLTAARDPATGYPRLADLAALDSAVALGDTALRLHWAGPQADLPDVLTDLAILPYHLLGAVPHAAMREAAWNRAPVGNGPYRFVAHEPNRRWVFVADSAFPSALGGPPGLGRVVIAVVDEPTTKLAALASGELDFAGINPAHASFLRRREGLAVIDYPLLFSYALVFNTRRPPFDDPAVRRAVSAAIDRREIVDGYLFGFGTPSADAIPPALAGGTPPAAPAADPAAARRLLGGRPLRLELLTVGSGDAALEQMLQAQLARAGITATIRQLELSTYLDRVQGPAHDFEVAVMGVPGDPGLGHLATLLATTGIAGPTARAALPGFFAEAVPAAFIYHARGVQGMNRRVRNVRMDLRGELASLHAWRVTP